MTGPTPASGLRPRLRAGWPEAAVVVGVLGGSAAVVLALVVVAPARSGWILLLGAAGIVAVALGLRSPVLACVYLLVATFFRLAVPGGTLPVDPFVLAFAGVLASTWLWTRPWRRGLSDVRLDPITCAIGLYVGWNVLSAVVPHAYPAGPVDQPGTYSLTRFLIIGIVMPFVMFLIGRRLFVDARAIRVLLWTVLAAAGYSALVSVLQFRAPEFVWPRYIAEDPNWADRAVGVFNQPVVNGLVLVIGFVVAMLIASHDTEGAGPRVLAGAIAVLIVYGVYLTHTRVVWLSFGLVVLLGVLLAKGFRTGFVLVAVVTAAAVLRNWSTFISADRTAGGVRSPEEIQDRLNNVATSFSAFTDEPIVGAGIGRFIAVNTYHHQAWSAETPWQRGFGISSHLDSLGILVELGLVGLVLWLLVSALLYSRLVRVVRRLPVGGMYDRALGLTALLCLLAQTITGLTVDLRFFDFPNIAVMLLAGAAIGWQRARAEADLARGAADEGPAPAPSPQVPEAVRS